MNPLFCPPGEAALFNQDLLLAIVATGVGVQVTKIPPGVVGRLAFAKELARLSSQLHALGSDVGNGESVVLLDAASESILRTVLASKGTRVGEGARFPELIAALASAYPELATEADAISRLHDARNEVQHRFILPARTQIDAIGDSAVHSLRSVIASAYGLAWADISAAELIQDSLIRELYRRGEAAFWKAHEDEAIVCLVACFEEARADERQQLFGSFVSWDRLLAEMATPTDEPGKAMVGFLKTTHDEVEILKLRVDYKEYRLYAEAGGGQLSDNPPLVPKSKRSSDEVFQSWHDRLTAKTALLPEGTPIGNTLTIPKGQWIRFALDFVLRTVLSWQQTRRRGFWDVLEAFAAEQAEDTPTAGHD